MNSPGNDGGRYFSINDVLDLEHNYKIKNYKLLGYIPSKDLQIRPCSSGNSVLLKNKETKEIYWIHFPNIEYENIIFI